ncbi:mitochondrial Homoaconitase [Lunasporangiospora selenospora]|uniref:Homoaconitase, mitochondrial n=1 Tax=Lunasporangiospora selenospora TaxID=979761 RepID=A0A9P6FW62_9FUNG|nr:mitochondrial Homoaconitase [Lunasporangiospora selenospora]
MTRMLATITTTTSHPQNMIEKIAQQYAVDLPPNHTVRSGDFVTIRPEHVLTHDNTGAVISKFKSIGAAQFKNSRQPVFALDHDVQNKTEKNLNKYATIEAFASQNSVDFYPAGRGIGHQVMVEEGYAFPGTLTVASDSHSNMYGGIGALGTPIVRTDAAAIWATGQTWWQVPPVVKVELKNQLAPGVTGKDVIITLCSVFNKDEVLNTAIEFTGEGVRALGIEDRLAIANMTTEWGALAGVFPIDDITRAYYEKRVHVLDRTRFLNKNIPPVPAGQEFIHPRINHERIEAVVKKGIVADEGAAYAKHLTLDLATVSPYISGPNSVKVAQPVADLKEVKVNKAYLVSCVNSRASDLRQAAAVVRGKKIAEGVEFYVAAASSEVQAEVEETGDWQALMEAGATPLPAGCGPCVGLGTGLLLDGEVGISATNRNFKGRMGSPKALAYLASPAVVAASAISGRIIAPIALASQDNVPQPATSIVTFSNQSSAQEESDEGSTSSEATITGFPAQLKGELLFCHADNLNTDGIYPGNPELVRDLVDARGREKLTDRTGWNATISLASGRVQVSREGLPDKVYRVGGLGKSIQELWVAGGLEGWNKNSSNGNGNNDHELNHGENVASSAVSPLEKQQRAERDRLLLEWDSRANYRTDLAESAKALERASSFPARLFTKEALLAATSAARSSSPSPASSAPKGSAPTKYIPITAVVLSWKRREGTKAVVAHLKKYPFIQEILVWNNNPDVVISVHDFEPLASTNGTTTSGATGPRTTSALGGPLITVFNSVANLHDFSKYTTCTLARFDHCYIQDDDWINLTLDSMYALFVTQPDTLVTSTMPAMHAQQRRWMFSNPQIGLHTGFAWLGAGSFMSKKDVFKFLMQLGGSNLWKERVQLSDLFFSLWRNQYPTVLSQALAPLDQSSSWSGRIDQWSVVYEHMTDAMVRITTMLSGLGIVNGSPHRVGAKVDFVAEEEEPLFKDRLSRSSCSNDKCLFQTSSDMFPMPEQVRWPADPQSRDILAHETRFRALEQSNTESVAMHTYHYAVDQDLSTCWRSLKSMEKGSFFGLYFILPLLDLGENARSLELWTFSTSTLQTLQSHMIIKASVDGVQWMVCVGGKEVKPGSLRVTDLNCKDVGVKVGIQLDTRNIQYLRFEMADAAAEPIEICGIRVGEMML